MGDYNMPSGDAKHYSTPPSVSGTGSVPMSVSYDQTSVDMNQTKQDSTGDRLHHATQVAKKIGTTSFLELGMEAASAIKNADKKELADNFKSGVSKATDKANEVADSAKKSTKDLADKFNSLDGSTKKKIIGGVVSAVLALSLIAGSCNKNTNTRTNNNYQTTPVASTQTGDPYSTTTPSTGNNNSSSNTNNNSNSSDTNNNSSSSSANTNSSANTEKADEEHDGKVDYEVYKFYWGNNGGYRKVKDTSVSVQYDSSESEDDRREITYGDVLDELVGKKGATGSIDQMIDANNVQTTKNIGTALQSLLINSGNHKKNSNKDPYTGKPMEILNNTALANEVVVEIRYDYSKMMSSSKRDISTGRIMLMMTSKNSEYRPHLGDFQAYILPNHQKTPPATYESDMFVFDHVPTAREFAKIIESNGEDFYTTVLEDPDD